VTAPADDGVEASDGAAPSRGHRTGGRSVYAPRPGTTGGAGAAPRILFVDHTAALGGGELSLLDIARHFRGTSRVLLLSDGPFRTRLEEAGVAVEVMEAADRVSRVTRGGGLLGDLQALPVVLQLARAVAERGRAFDVLYANSQKSMLIAALAGLMARKPVVWHLRDIMSAEHFSGLHRRVAARAANALTRRVLANSEATRQAFIGSGGRGDKARVVHNGIDARPFGSVDDEEIAELRKALGLGNAPVVGVFSRLAPWKGQHVLLEALGSLPGVHGVVVGEALFEGDKAYAEELFGAVRRLGLDGRVHFLGFRKDIPRLLRMCDVVAHTSIAPEPFGRVIVEGMLAGRPVVATRAGGVVEIIEDGRTGRLVPPGDAAALAEALRAVLGDGERTRSMAEDGRRAARERFSLDAMLAGVERHIAEAVDQRVLP
jgi:glycosyltransferase involved in cell wall biosynthesis